MSVKQRGIHKNEASLCAFVVVLDVLHAPFTALTYFINFQVHAAASPARCTWSSCWWRSLQHDESFHLTLDHILCVPAELLDGEGWFNLLGFELLFLSHTFLECLALKNVLHERSSSRYESKTVLLGFTRLWIRNGEMLRNTSSTSAQSLLVVLSYVGHSRWSFMQCCLCGVHFTSRAL